MPTLVDRALEGRCLSTSIKPSGRICDPFFTPDKNDDKKNSNIRQPDHGPSGTSVATKYSGPQSAISAGGGAPSTSSVLEFLSSAKCLEVPSRVGDNQASCIEMIK